MQFILRLLLSAAALWVATRIVPGISYQGGGFGLLGVALVFGVVNAILKPVLTFFSIPFILVTFGLFLLVVNGLTLWATGSLSRSLGLGFRVDGFTAAFLGAIVVSLVNVVLSWFVGTSS